MKPLNNKERNKAFLKVTGLFLTSFIIAIILGFTTLNTGKLSEQQSKSELDKLKSDLKFQKEVFAPNVDETTTLLSKVPKAKETGENLEVLNQDIAALLSRTKNQVKDEETWETGMYKNVIQVLSDLQLAYNDHLKLSEQLGDASSAGQKLQEITLDRDRLMAQLNMLQAGGGGGGGGGGGDAQMEKKLKDLQQQLNRCNLENRALKQEIDKFRNR